MALGARTEALQGGALVNVGVLHIQVVGAKAVVVLGVGDGGTQDLGHGLGGGALAELQRLQSLVDGLVADLVNDQASLARGDADVTGISAIV